MEALKMLVIGGASMEAKSFKIQFGIESGANTFSTESTLML
jgi:hypothetical protein